MKRPPIVAPSLPTIVNAVVMQAKACRPLGCALCIRGRRHNALLRECTPGAGAECGKSQPGEARWCGGRIANLIHCGDTATLGMVLRHVTRRNLRQTERVMHDSFVAREP